MDRTGKRKYSVPRLASARGEEEARRAMPASSVAGFPFRQGAGGGGEALLGISQLPWRAAVGNRVRVARSARVGWRRSAGGLARSMGEVAIESLAERRGYYSPFVRPSSRKFAFLSPVPRDSFPSGNSAGPPPAGPLPRSYTGRATLGK